MFYGEYEHNLDEKGRIIIPSKLRTVFNNKGISSFVLTRGLDRCLFLFSIEEWQKQDEKFRAMPFTKPEARQFNRLYFSGACETSFDKQGRFSVPTYLKDYASIKSKVMIIGVSNRIEIWDYEQWKSYFDSSLSSFETIAENLIEE